MKKILITFLLTASPLLSNANQVCVPTSSVEKAKELYDSKVDFLHKKLKATYSELLNIHNDTIKQAQVDLMNSYQIASDNYSLGVKELRGVRDPNRSVIFQVLEENYTSEVNYAYNNYSKSIEKSYSNYESGVTLAKSAFNVEAQEIADEYNKSVCAQ